MDWATSAWRDALVLLTGFKIAMTILVFMPALQTFDMPKALIGRGITWLLVAVLVIALARHGPRILPQSRIHLAVAALIGAQLVAAITAKDRYIAVFGEWDRFMGLTFTLDMVVVYIALAAGVRTAQHLAPAAALIGLAGALSATVGVLQRAGVDPIGGALGLGPDLAARPYSTFGNPDMFGQFLGPAFGASAALVLVLQGRLRYFAALCALLFLAALAVVATRAVLLGLVAVAATVALLAMRVAALPRALRFGALAAIPAVAALVLLSPLGGRALSSLQGGASIQDRLLLWESALAMARDYPIFGVGPDNFGVAYPPYRQPGSAPAFNHEAQTHAHSWPLQAGATTGLVGLAAAGTFAASVLIALIRALEKSAVLAAPALAAAAAYLAQGLVTVSSVSVEWIPWVAAGVVASLAPRTSAGVKRPPRWTILAAAAVAVVGLAAGSFALRANGAAGQALLALERGDPQGALSYAELATELDGGRAEYWALLGSANLALGQWRASLAAFQEAAERKPSQTFFHQQIARSRTRLVLRGDPAGGSAEAALDAARRGVALSPNDGDPYYVLAALAMDLRRPEEALRASVRAIVLRTRYSNADEYAVAAASQVPDRQSVRQLLLDAIAVVGRDTAAGKRLAAALPID